MSDFPVSNLFESFDKLHSLPDLLIVGQHNRGALFLLDYVNVRIALKV